MHAVQAQPLAEHTVFVRKRTFARVGIVLEGEGDEFPVVRSSTHPQIYTGDIVYVVNGRRMRGAAGAAFAIRWRRYLSITVLRASASEAPHGLETNSSNRVSRG